MSLARPILRRGVRADLIPLRAVIRAFGGGGLVGPNLLRSPIVLSRAQAPGVRAVDQVGGYLPTGTFLAPANLLWPLVLSRAQVAGVQVWEDT